MKRYFIFILILLIPFVISCNSEDMDSSEFDLSQDEIEAIERNNISGKIRIKIEEDFVGILDNQVNDSISMKSDFIIKTINSKTNYDISNLNYTSAERTFPINKLYEDRTEVEGLNLWYDLSFDKNIPLTTAYFILKNDEKITHVEYISKYNDFSRNIKDDADKKIHIVKCELSGYSNSNEYHLSQSEKEACKYFYKYSGIDDNGNHINTETNTKIILVSDKDTTNIYRSYIFY